MSMIDVLTRVDAICKKYDRYDADKHRNDGDPFSRMYAAVDAEIDAAIEVSFSLPCDLPLALGCLTVTVTGGWPLLKQCMATHVW
jgi:hypothetical protein